jgi:hypothetical protein
LRLKGELIADVIGAIVDLVRTHPRWVNLGLAFIESFDKIDLAQVRKTAKATGVQPLRDAIMMLLCVELEKILGPSKLPKPRGPSMADIVKDKLALGAALLELKNQAGDNFWRLAHERFKIDQKGEYRTPNHGRREAVR